MAKRSSKSTASPKKIEREGGLNINDQQANIRHKIIEGRRKHSHETKSINIGKLQFIIFFGIGLGTSLIVGAYIWYQLQLQKAIISPIKLPKMIQDNNLFSENQKQIEWGSFRSGVYFGLKTKSQNSPVYGFMWMNQPALNVLPPIRHWCNQHDGFYKYGWQAHDGRNFGIHVSLDNDLIIVNDFVKQSGGTHGGDWTSRVKVSLKKSASPRFVSAFVYMALDGQGHLAATTANNKLISIRGRSEHLGAFNLQLPREIMFSKNQSTKPYLWTDYLVTHVNSLDDLHNIVSSKLFLRKIELANGQIYKIVSLPGVSMPKGMNENEANFIVLQVTAITPFEFETVFESFSNSHRPNRLTGETYQTTLNHYLQSFYNQFENKFQLKLKGFDESSIIAAREILSNTVGGIGYFYGASLVQSPLLRNPIDYFEGPLLTAVPSRSFFPRGFLWDEGFHQLLISQWDVKISMEIISHWFDLMNANGWIPREQILGGEARARVPPQFVVQWDDVANPPTFFLPLRRILHQYLHGDYADQSDEVLNFLRRLKPRLVAWFNWLNETQANDDVTSFHWRGRNDSTRLELNPKTLASGLDDFPRASHPSNDERHIDLRCWMATAAHTIGQIVEVVVGSDAALFFMNAAAQLSDQSEMDVLHWSEEMGRYADFGMHTDKVNLPKPEKQLNPNIAALPVERIVHETPVAKLVDSVFGYVNIFPFLTKLLNPSSTQLFKILNDIKNPKLLWTKYGLRSLSPTSPTYDKYNTQHDPPYWRGAIWININYMAIAALNHYGLQDGPYQQVASELYIQLRDNVITNILNEYKKTGYVWEQYNDKTGEGKGSRPFTGWSALVVSIMAEQYW